MRVAPDPAAFERAIHGSFPSELSPPLTKKPLSVLLLMIDSVSAAHFRRELPQTYQYLDRLNSHSWIPLLGHNIVGSRSMPNQGALMMGSASPQAPRNDPVPGWRTRTQPDWCSTTPCVHDDWPFVWKAFSERGYVTLYGVEACATTMWGFDSRPTDHWLQPHFCTALRYNPWRDDLHCIDSRPSHNLTLGYLREFWEQYGTVGRFALVNLLAGHEKSGMVLGTLDTDLFNWLKGMAPILEDTAVLLFSDHGLTYGFGRMAGGLLELETPAAHLLWPQWLNDRHPWMIKTLKENAVRLTTARDLHRTLLHLLTFPDPPQHHSGTSPPTHWDSHPLAISLLETIPTSRTCAEAAIPPELCACTPWVPVALPAVAADALGQLAFAHIAKLTASSPPGLCGALGPRVDLIKASRQDQTEGPTRITILFKAEGSGNEIWDARFVRPGLPPQGAMPPPKNQPSDSDLQDALAGRWEVDDFSLEMIERVSEWGKGPCVGAARDADVPPFACVCDGDRLSN